MASFGADLLEAPGPRAEETAVAGLRPPLEKPREPRAPTTSPPLGISAPAAAAAAAPRTDTGTGNAFGSTSSARPGPSPRAAAAAAAARNWDLTEAGLSREVPEFLARTRAARNPCSPVSLSEETRSRAGRLHRK